MFEPQFHQTPLYASMQGGPSLSPSSPENNVLCSHGLSFDYPQDNSTGTSRSGGPILLTDPIYNGHDPCSGRNITNTNDTTAGSSLNYNDNHNLNHSSQGHQHHLGMESYTLESDFEAQQDAARRFQPELTGPLVGQKRSTQAITEEYAGGDPTYVMKTQALPNTYSHYRAILGDGNCGWRAITFSYYEMLQKLADKALVDAEVQRLAGMHVMLEASGFDSTIFEDFQDEALQLLRDIAGTIHMGPFDDSNSLVLQRFNDAETSSPIIYYFRLLASSWINMNSDSYAGFIEGGMTVDEYRNEVLQPVATEMDHIAMTLLVDVLLKPINARAEVVYLDRSTGSKVDAYFVESPVVSSMPQDSHGPIIYLLYRPGHYDILYKETTLQPQIVPQDYQPIVNRVSSLGHQQWEAAPSMYSGGSWDMDLLADIPGMSMGMGFGAPANNQYFPALNSSNYGIIPMSSDSKNQSSVSPAASPANFLDMSYTSTPSVCSQPALSMPHHPFSPTHSSMAMSLHPTTPSDHSSPMSRHHSFSSGRQHHSPENTLDAMHSHHVSQPFSSDQFSSPPLPLGPTSSLHSSLGQTGIMRPSRYTVEAEFAHPEPPPLLTSTMRDSHHNVCHFANPDFTPVQWGQEDLVKPPSDRRARRKKATTS